MDLDIGEKYIAKKNAALNRFISGDLSGTNSS